MKKISDYRKLLGVNESVALTDLKTVYRSLMKDWHPDKFSDNDVSRTLAEQKSKEFIEAYHFLVSIASETRANTFAEYTETITKASILDYEWKSQMLVVKFSDGNAYEYFDVPREAYVKLHQSDAQARFARRHIFNAYVYRSVTKIAQTA